MRHRTMIVAFLAATAACAHGGTKRVQRDPYLVTQDEIERVTAANAYDAVQSLRPAWLRSRTGPTSFNGLNDVPMVYLDGMKLGDVNQLSRIPVVGIVSIRFMSAIEANQRYGRGHEGGAILVDTRQ